MHYSVILNPTAGNGRATNIGKEIQEQLRQANVEFDLQTTKDASSAAYFAHRIYQNRQASDTVVIVVGGDGTLHDVLNGLQQVAAPNSLFPLAYVPASKLSRFARAYGIPTDPEKAIHQILTTTTTQDISVGRCRDAIKGTDSYFLNSFGIGFDAALISRASRQRHRKHFRWGHLAFLLHSASVLYDQQPFQLMVTHHQHREPYSKAYLVVINNHPFTDSGVQLASSTGLQQPSLDLTIAERRGWPLTLWQLRQFYRGQLPNSRFANHFSGCKFHCTTPSLEFSQIDGEDRGNRFIDLTFTVTTYPFWQTPLTDKQ